MGRRPGPYALRGRQPGPGRRRGAAGRARSHLEADLSSEVESGRWEATGTDAADVAAQLARLHTEHQRRELRHAAARTLNLVVAPVRGEGEEAVIREIERLGGHSPARAIVLRDHEQDRLDAEAVLDCELPDEPGLVGICHDRVVLSADPPRLDHADSLIAPLLVGELPVIAWMPDAEGPHRDAVARRADHLVTDSGGDGSLLDASAELAEHGPVHDLAWGRLERWRGAVSSAWNPPDRRARLSSVSEVEISHGADATAEALLLGGWIAARAGLAPDAVTLEAGAAGIASVRFVAAGPEIDVEPPPATPEGGAAFARALVPTRAFGSGYTDALTVARQLHDRS